MPPVAATVAEYAMPAVPLGNDAVVMEIGAGVLGIVVLTSFEKALHAVPVWSQARAAK